MFLYMYLKKNKKTLPIRKIIVCTMSMVNKKKKKKKMVQGLFVTCRIHITNRLPMFHQHVFVILLWGILMSPLSMAIKVRGIMFYGMNYVTKYNILKAFLNSNGILNCCCKLIRNDKYKAHIPLRNGTQRE